MTAMHGDDAAMSVCAKSGGIHGGVIVIRFVLTIESIEQKSRGAVSKGQEGWNQIAARATENG